MKASIKFREEQKPLLRTKIPLNILSFPFQSGIVAGEYKELSLNLSTFFDAGPAFKIAYRPNDTQNPFSLVCKTGIGHFGSPISSPFTMSAEFNFVGNQNPTFFIHFKPKIGDFAIKKSHSSSVLAKKTDPSSVSPDEVAVLKTRYLEESGLFPRAGKISVLPAESAAAAAAATSVMDNVFSGTKINARTAFPLKNRAVVNFRWGLRFPPAAATADGAEDTVIVGTTERTTGISFRKFPMLLMDKISIEHVAKAKNTKDSKLAWGSNLTGTSDVAEVCLDVKKQLEIIQAENGLLRRALDDMRSEFAAGKFNLSVGGGGGGTVDTGKQKENGHKYSGSGRGDRRNSGGGGGDRRSSDTSGKGMEADMNEELKKALMGASGA